MTPEILTAILGCVGTMIGTITGILTSSKLTAYRIAQLEKKVDKHNDFAARIPVVEEQIRGVVHRIEALEDQTHKE